MTFSMTILELDLTIANLLKHLLSLELHKWVFMDLCSIFHHDSILSLSLCKLAMSSHMNANGLFALNPLYIYLLNLITFGLKEWQVDIISYLNNKMPYVLPIWSILYLDSIELFSNLLLRMNTVNFQVHINVMMKYKQCELDHNQMKTKDLFG